MTTPSSIETEHVGARIDDWRRRLIDLTHRNRLIAYKPTRATTLEIVAPSIDELLAEPDRAQPWDFFFPTDDSSGDEGTSEAATAVDQLMLSTRSSRSRGSNEIQVSEENPKRISRILDNLAKRSNTEYEDKALRILYIAAGFLDWHDAHRDKPISSPLILVPVALRRETARDPYRLYFVDDEDIVVNPSLTEKLRRDAGLDLADTWEWEDKPVAAELEEIREAVRGTGWKVRDNAVVGLFSFQKYVMYRDLLDNESRVASHAMVRSLANGRLVQEIRDHDPDVPGLRALDESQAPSETLSILDADASQRQCVEAAKLGRSFVMQGPPGTGKSQTIANIIAEVIGKGQRVLFVSEKAAALDVVLKRLAEKELDEYCLTLHGEKAARREVVQTLDASLTSRLQARPSMRSDEMERLSNLRTLLNDSAETLHLPQPLLGGRTLRELHEELADLHDALVLPGAPPPGSLIDQEVLDEYQTLAEVFQRLAERWYVSAPDYAWRGYSGDRFGVEEHGQAVADLARVSASLGGVASVAGLLASALEMSPAGSVDAAERLARVAAHLTGAPPIQSGWLDLGAASVGKTVEAAASAFSTLEERKAEFKVLFPARDVEAFPPGIGEALEDGISVYRRRFGWARAWTESLDRLPGAVLALDALPGMVDSVRERVATVAGRTGQPTQQMTKRAVEALVDLAHLSFRAERRPERDWLVPAGLDRVEALLETLAEDFDDYQRHAADIGEVYDEAVLDLDAAAIRTRFTDQYTSVFSKLTSSYRSDARAIKEVRKDRRLPQSLVDDLDVIAEARAIGSRLDDKAESLSEALGTYYGARATDVLATREAIGNARQALALASGDSDLDALAGVVGVGSRPDAELARAADQLREAVARMDGCLAEVQPFVEAPADLYGGDLDGLAGIIEELGRLLRPVAQLVEDLTFGAATTASSITEVVKRAELASELHSMNEEIAHADASWRRVLGRRYSGGESSWDDLREAVAWMSELPRLLDEAPPESLRSRLEREDPDWPEPQELLEQLRTCRLASTSLVGLFDDPRRGELDVLVRSQPFAEVQAVCDELLEQVDGLRDWTEWRAWRDEARELGWEGFVEMLIENDASAVDVLPAFRRSYWNRRLEAFYDDDPELAEDLRGGAFQRWVDEFRELDRKLVRTGADRLIAQREKVRDVQIVAPGTETELLRREARKRRRHLPVRVLLARMPTLLSDLKPCLMMSPMTVSHFLSPAHDFDVVIFDEASQVTPQDAVNCIYRGRQLIVAGDSKQLPPTPFFQIAELDEFAPEEEEASTQEDMESILDACEALLPSHSLTWHYRSRSEPLIAFSNHKMYDDGLVTFPSVEEAALDRGIGWTYVPDGIYDRGHTASNRREAVVVAERVMAYLLDGSGRSVGVIAFNTSQAAAIDEELDLLKIRHPQLEEHFRGDRLDAVFVKHLEAVQGDERDVIVFSVGYGFDSSGAFTTNFGPLNKQGGQRRLNVAVTRARERVELVSSVRSHDFQLSEGASAGATMLRDYVAYAEAGGVFGAPVGAVAEVEWPSPLEEQVARAVAHFGFVAEPRIGVGKYRIDIGVRPAHPVGGSYILGIECDGQSYSETPTARDRERLRHEVLGALGWGPIHRIWSLDWVRNRSAELTRLGMALDEAVARRAVQGTSGRSSRPQQRDSEDAPQRPRERETRVVVDLGTAGAAAALPWTEVFRRANLEPQSSFYAFHESFNRSAQVATLTRLVAEEGPVTVSYAVRRLAEAWGLQRVGNRVLAAARQAIKQAERRGALEIRGDSLWRPHQILTRVRIPDPDDPETRREIDEIVSEEIDLAVMRVRESAGVLDEEQLIGQVSRVLGFDRTGGRIRTALKQRINVLDR